MLSQDVESDGKGEDMAGHEEDEEEQLSNAEQFATKPAHHDLAGVGHTEHMGVFLFKLADNIAGICCDETDAHKDNQRSVTGLAFASRCVCVCHWNQGCILRNQPKRCHRRGQRKHTQGDGLGDHDWDC